MTRHRHPVGSDAELAHRPGRPGTVRHLCVVMRGISAGRSHANFGRFRLTNRFSRERRRHVSLRPPEGYASGGLIPTTGICKQLWYNIFDKDLPKSAGWRDIETKCAGMVSRDDSAFSDGRGTAQTVGIQAKITESCPRHGIHPLSPSLTVSAKNRLFSMSEKSQWHYKPHFRRVRRRLTWGLQSDPGHVPGPVPVFMPTSMCVDTSLRPRLQAPPGGEDGITFGARDKICLNTTFPGL